MSAPEQALRPRRIVAAMLVAAACIGGLAGAETARRVNAYPTRLPAGSGRGVTEQRCVICHSAMLIVQQRKDSTGWEKTLGQMEKWSAPIPPPDREALRGYLLSHFGPSGARGENAPKPASTQHH